MSETTGTGRGTTDTPHAPTPLTDTPRSAAAGAPGTPVVHESYSFACLRCGHGWEQSYDIEHHFDAQRKEFVVYKADGRQVPSPLSQPTCDHCDGHVVRIMRPGRVSTVLDSMHGTTRGGSARSGATRAASREARRSGGSKGGATDSGLRPAGAGTGHAARHLWHVSNLVRLLHLQRRAR